MYLVFTKYKRSLIALTSIIACIFLFTQCVDNTDKTVIADSTINQPNTATQATSFTQYAGSKVCAGCHKAIYDSFMHTAHYLTPTPATEKFIKGSFKKGKNEFAYTANHVVAMEKRDSGLYEVEYDSGVEKRRTKFDISIGSGVRKILLNPAATAIAFFKPLLL